MALLAIPVAVLAMAGWRNRWMADDGLINLRVVEQLLAGNGPVFNSAERVEAVTSPLWIWLLAVSRLVLGSWVRLEWVAVVLGLALAVFGLAAAEVGGLLLAKESRRRSLLVPAGAVVVAALPPFADFATSGLETGLMMGWLGGSWWALASRISRVQAGEERPMLAAWGVPVLFGLGPLVRPDLALFTIAFLTAWLVVSTGSWRARGAAVIVALALPVGYQVFRMGYYGSMVPNTALAKEAGEVWWSQGWFYVGDLVTRYQLWWPAILLTAATTPAWLAQRPGHAALRLGVARWLVVPASFLSIVYVARLGGDFMQARLLLPAVFGATLPVSVMAIDSSRRWIKWLQRASLAGLAAWGVIAISPHPPPTDEYTWLNGIADERRMWIGATQNDNPVLVEDFANLTAYELAAEIGARRANGEEVAVLLTAGVIGRPSADGWGTVLRSETDGVIGRVAGTEVNLADIHGLGEPVVARMQLRPERRRPGHEKIPEPAYLIARYTRADESDSPEVVAAREALACGELAELDASVRDDLTLGRFFSNLVNARRLTTFRVPRDPFEARDRFCGPAGA